MRTRRISFDWITVYCDSPTAIFIPIGPWMDASEITNLRMSLELAARVGNLQVQPAYQTANDIRSPDTAASFGSTLSSEGFGDPSSLTDVSSTFGGKQQVRFGLMVSNTTGTDFSAGRAQGSLLLVSR